MPTFSALSDELGFGTAEGRSSIPFHWEAGVLAAVVVAATAAAVRQTRHSPAVAVAATAAEEHRWLRGSNRIEGADRRS